MATKIGPKTVTQRDRSKALVFCIDAAHSDSYGGPPATNLVDFDNIRGTNGAHATWVAEADSYYYTFTSLGNYRYKFEIDNDSSSGFGLVIPATVSASTAYTFSVRRFLRHREGAGDDRGFYIRYYDSGDNVLGGGGGYYNTSGSATAPGEYEGGAGVSDFFSATFTTPSSCVKVEFYVGYGGSIKDGDWVVLQRPQIEAGSVATPFTATSRSASTAVKNISGVGAQGTTLTGSFATYGQALQRASHVGYGSSAGGSEGGNEGPARNVNRTVDPKKGHIGGAYWDFDGSDEYISFGDVALNLSTGATMAFWCEHADNTNGAVLGSDDDSYHSYIQPHENGNIYFESSDDSNTAYGVMSGTTGFHHYVVSVTGYTATIYENGVAITTDSSLSSANVTFNYIGTSGAKWFNGKVASVMMWSAPLTAKEIKDIYIAQKGRFGK